MKYLVARDESEFISNYSIGEDMSELRCLLKDNIEDAISQYREIASRCRGIGITECTDYADPLAFMLNLRRFRLVITKTKNGRDVITDIKNLNTVDIQSFGKD